MLSEQEVLQIFEVAGAVITEGHFVYASGKHGTTYFNKDAVYPHTRLTSLLCEEIAQRFADDNVQVVIAPAIGGVILSQWVAHHLSGVYNNQVLGIYAEQSEGQFVIRRGYDKLVRGRRVLVVEDVLNTGGSAGRVVAAVRAVGGGVIGVCALCNRGGVTASDVGEVPKLATLVDMPLDAWEAADCPICKRGVKVNTDVGKGRK